MTAVRFEVGKYVVLKGFNSTKMRIESIDSQGLIEWEWEEPNGSRRREKFKAFQLELWKRPATKKMR